MVFRKDQEPIKLKSSASGQPFTLDKGRTLILNNPPYIPLLVRGEAVISIQRLHEEDMCLGIYTPYSVFGEPLTQKHRPYTKRIQSLKESTIIPLSRSEERLTNQYAEETQTAKDRDGIQAEQRLLFLDCKAPEKLAALLLHFTQGKVGIPADIPQHLLASIAGISRVMVNTTLRLMEKNGTITNNHSVYEITDEAQLAKLTRMASRVPLLTV